jgi:ABC-type antimicrobial peptide transport system permease subunit
MILVRTAGNPLTVLPAIRKAIWSVNNDVPIIGDQAAAEDRLDRLLAQRRFSMALLVLFGVLGLAISAVGIYGVLAYLVAQRTSEIGVRMALGATPGGVVAMVLRRAGALIGVGLALGAGVAWYFSAVAKSFLFQIEPTDPRVFAAALAVLAVAGLAASVVPARRAASVDPIVALRQE